jgi:cytochrome P450
MLLLVRHEATLNLIAAGIYSPLRQPEKMAELRNNPALTRSAVEQFLRIKSPIQYTARVTTEPIELCGVRIPKRQTILCMLGAVNREPKQFKDPDTLMLNRLSNQLLHARGNWGPGFSCTRAGKRGVMDCSSKAARAAMVRAWLIVTGGTSR